MPRHGTPYEYGDERPDGGLTDEVPTSDADTVIVDGDALSFRAYRRRRD